ncbi:DUF3221 domain-containing protein [Pseudalkalibacillus caeni]|uniref:DUF3221 domain-containing protein n=1 Tax=Exobacillus caeni TaxID=2574798 RepID=A0A5R9F1A8_9BACL|nr:DUF3221 domain-containing protein [Pseudalkalibacillus caeni]TLS35228.1 DUF3221 domain-containing protein [Pseudalkalibacillus caeni]
MKNLFLSLLLIAWLLFLSGILFLKNEVYKEPDIKGYVTEVTGNRALIVSEERDSNVFDATLVNLPFMTRLQLGEHVKVWYDGSVEQTYPARTHAEKIERVKEKDGRSRLSRDAVIRLFLNDLNQRIISFRRIEYNPNLAKWEVDVITSAGGNNQHYSYLVDDMNRELNRAIK